MRILLCIFLVASCAVSAQRSKMTYGFSFNKGYERVYPEDKTLDVSKTRAFGFYLHLGRTLEVDSTFLFYAGLRYGRENSRFRISAGNRDLDYRTSNTSLSLVFAPGVRINKRHALFLNLGIVRVLQANHGGGGGGERNGRSYSYEYVPNLPQNAWEFRPGIKWQVQPKLRKKLCLEFGIEPSMLTRKLEMKLRDANPNLPVTVYRARYDLILFYTGFVF